MIFHFLDILFDITHGLFVLFILFGWVVPSARKAHIGATAMIVFSWFVLGYWYGWGYCFWTDVHWQIKREIGYQNLPASYLAYVAERCFGLSLSSQFINTSSAVTFGLCMSLAAYVNFIAPKSRFRLPSWSSHKQRLGLRARSD